MDRARAQEHGFRIEEVTRATPEVHAALAELVTEMGPTAPSFSEADLAEIVAAPATTLWIARDTRDGRVLGTVTFVLFRIPTGLTARLETLVVHPMARGRGVGEALCRIVISRAAACGASHLNLTCTPARAAANRLYQRLGFQPRATNVYRLPLAVR